MLIWETTFSNDNLSVDQHRINLMNSVLEGQIATH